MLEMDKTYNSSRPVRNANRNKENLTQVSMKEFIVKGGKNALNCYQDSVTDFSMRREEQIYYSDKNTLRAPSGGRSYSSCENSKRTVAKQSGYKSNRYSGRFGQEVVGNTSNVRLSNISEDHPCDPKIFVSSPMELRKKRGISNDMKVSIMYQN